ncbi:MAG: response regulator transcription factor [Nitrospira sp.]|nr:response regulator transcription factor [Nitrospira sp.]
MSGTLAADACQDLPPAKVDVRILLADDHALLRRGLREFLRDFLVEDGLTPDIVETASARQAIDHIRTDTWDLVILDLNLPDMPGLEVLRIFKSLRPTLPVLVVSIYAEEHYSARAIRAGALGYLTKERGPQELRLAVSRILQGGDYLPSPETEHSQDEGPPHRNSSSTDTLPATLSDREIEVLQWIAQGRRLTEIAEHLNLSIKTVSTYRSRLLIKLGMRTTAELIRYALDQQLV